GTRQRPAAGGNPRKAKGMGYFVFAQGSRTAERSAARRWESARRADGSARQTAAEVRARFRQAEQATGEPSRAARTEQGRLLRETALGECGTSGSSNHGTGQGGTSASDHARTSATTRAGLTPVSFCSSP